MRSQLFRRFRALTADMLRRARSVAPASLLRGSIAWCSSGGSAPSRRDIRAGLDELDDPFTKGKQKKRVSLPLEEEAPVVADEQEDAVEAIKSDYVDALNDVLGDKTLLHVFKGFRLPSQLCEVVDVQFDRQQSHIIAFWRSEFVDRLALDDSAKDKEKYKRTADKIANHISETLNKYEGRVRTALMQRGDFRRVPRVEFRPISARKIDYLSPSRIRSLLNKIQET